MSHATPGGMKHASLTEIQSILALKLRPIAVAETMNPTHGSSGDSLKESMVSTEPKGIIKAKVYLACLLGWLPEMKPWETAAIQIHFCKCANALCHLL